MEYRRDYAGTRYFFTVVSRDRLPVFGDPAARRVLASVVAHARVRWPFSVDAWVLLPDHIHTIWALPPDDRDYSRRWAWIKKETSKRYFAAVDADPVVRARCTAPRPTIWQQRFWEHRLRDDSDYRNHCNYIHYNPVRHGLVTAPQRWPFSSFGHHVARGSYAADWGASEVAIPEDVGAE